MSTPTNTLVKLGAFVVGLAVLAYVGVRLDEGGMGLPHVPFLGSSSAPAAHVVTPEEDVAAQIKADPSLVSRSACTNLYVNAPTMLTMLSHPSRADFDAMSNDELRALAVDVVTTANGPQSVAGVALLTDHARLVNGLTRWSAFPRFANPNGDETKRVNAYLNACRAIYPSRDESAANFVRLRSFTLVRVGMNLMNLVRIVERRTGI